MFDLESVANTFINPLQLFWFCQIFICLFACLLACLLLRQGLETNSVDQAILKPQRFACHLLSNAGIKNVSYYAQPTNLFTVGAITLAKDGT